MVTYADRPWLKHYDSGVPASLQPYPSIPLFQFLREAAQKYPSNVALVTQTHVPVAGRIAKSLTYAEVDAASDALAVGLIKMGLKKGDRVALVMPNTASFIISYYGILKAGGVVAATNPTYPAEKMQFQINDSGAKFVITLTLFYNMLKEIQPRTHVKSLIVTNVKEYLPGFAALLFAIAKEKKTGHALPALQPGDVWLKDVLSENAGKKPDVSVTGDDLAIFQYTGGTTGVSKAAASQHKAVVANIIQSKAILLNGSDSSGGSNEIFLGAIPFFHVYGLVTVVGFAMSLGARIILVPNARDIDDVVDTIVTFKPTLFMGVPALYNGINNHPRVKSGEASLKSIRVCMSGSAPLPAVTKRTFEQLSGGKLLEGYGMSETPTATHANPVNGENRTGSIGLPFPDLDCKVVSLEDGVTEMPVGEVGELLMSGPQMMTGYHNQPEETAKVLRDHPDGKRWLHTGDIAKMDEDGYFYIVDRKKDMVLIGGFNVYPVQVDKVLAEHPSVLECAVAGVPHEEKQGQEMLKGWIVLRPNCTATSDELIAHCLKYLSRYEVPTRFTFVEALPKSVVGKTLRRELIEMELKERAQKKAGLPVSS